MAIFQKTNNIKLLIFINFKLQKGMYYLPLFSNINFQMKENKEELSLLKYNLDFSEKEIHRPQLTRKVL